MKAAAGSLAVAVVADACGGGGDAGRAVREDSAGVEIVRQPGEDRPLAWRFESVWSIGGSPGDTILPAELAPHDVAVDVAGRVLVLDEAGSRVLVLATEGTIEGAVGRSGSGPGELQSPVALAAEPGGGFAVFDYGRGGFVRWSPGGEPRGLRRVESDFWGPAIAVLDGETFAFVSLGGTPAEPVERLVAEGPDGTRVVREFRPPPRTPAEFPSCGIRAPPIAPLFAPELLWDAAGGLVVTQASARYALEIRRDGRLVRAIRRAVAPRPADRGAAVAAAGEGLHIGVTGCTVPPEEVATGRGWMDRIPTVAALALAPGGELWARRGGVDPTETPIDVLEVSGAYLGTLPAGSPWPAAFLPEGGIVAIERDVLDVPRLTAYRVLRRGE